jgi:hypothetical protein
MVFSEPAHYYDRDGKLGSIYNEGTYLIAVLLPGHSSTRCSQCRAHISRSAPQQQVKRQVHLLFCGRSYNRHSIHQP